MEWPKVMWYLWQKLIILLDLKVVALSVIIFSGQPNLDKMLVSKNCIIIESLAFLQGMASIHLVKQSVAVKIHLC